MTLDCITKGGKFINVGTKATENGQVWNCVRNTDNTVSLTTQIGTNFEFIALACGFVNSIVSFDRDGMPIWRYNKNCWYKLGCGQHTAGMSESQWKSGC